ncbi:MAG: alanine:cation symporter family protein [Verrucomicrobiales bacterium]
MKTARGKYTPPDAPGQITHFQALSAALSATVGNKATSRASRSQSGLGGPGATFWMIVMGLCGMTTKFVECTLGVKYRKIDPDGTVRGGGMYYLSEGLKSKGAGGLGMFLAVFFAIMTIGGAIGAGNMFQVNQAHAQFAATFVDVPGWAFGLVVAVLVGLVIIGGIVWIARVTSFLVPFMCITYVIASLVIIGLHLEHVPDAFAQIFKMAFSPRSIGGGIIGVLIQGIKRAITLERGGAGVRAHRALGGEDASPPARATSPCSSHSSIPLSSAR